MVDPDGRDGISTIMRLLQVVRYNSPRAISIPTAVETLVSPILDAAFGPNIYTDPGGLKPHEAAFLKEVGAYKGMNTMGIARGGEPGIDGFAFSRGLSSMTALSLRQYDGTSLQGPLDAASGAETSALNAGYAGKNIELYIKAGNLSAAAVADFAVGGQQNRNLAAISRQGAFKSISVFTKDGIVRIVNGQVTVERR
jgi:hypothetical protein